MTEKYGRYLADLTIETTGGELSPSTVNATMIAVGHAVPYTDGKR